jgi:hypothetical protein
VRYPKTPGPSGAKLEKCVAFEKLDGTNLFWEWRREFGWTDFGTRSATYPLHPGGMTEFAARHPGLGVAAELFADPSEGLGRVLESRTEVQHAFVYSEFVGPNSFAGMHKPDDPKRLVFFDLFIVGYGFVNPWRFRELLADVPTPAVVYEGKFTGNFTEDVRAGKYLVCEGVVVKGGSGGADVWMAKVKTAAYLDRLKASFGERWEEFWE